MIGAEAAVAALLMTALFGSLGLGSRGDLAGLDLPAPLLGTNIQRAMEGYRFFSPQYEVLSVGAVSLLLLAAVRVIAFPTRALLDTAWPRDAAHALAFPSDPLALPMWSTIIFVAYAWWRGRTRDEPSLEAAYRTLARGDAGGDRRDPRHDGHRRRPTTIPALRRALYGGTIVFLLLTLAAIALGRLRIEQARGALTLTPRWLLTFLGPVAGLVLVGTLVAGIFTRRFLETLLWLLTPVFRLADLHPADLRLHRDRVRLRHLRDLHLFPRPARPGRSARRAPRRLRPARRRPTRPPGSRRSSTPTRCATSSCW